MQSSSLQIFQHAECCYKKKQYPLLANTSESTGNQQLRCSTYRVYLKDIFFYHPNWKLRLRNCLRKGDDGRARDSCIGAGDDNSPRKDRFIVEIVPNVPPEMRWRPPVAAATGLPDNSQISPALHLRTPQFHILKNCCCCCCCCSCSCSCSSFSCSCSCSCFFSFSCSCSCSCSCTCSCSCSC